MTKHIALFLPPLPQVSGGLMVLLQLGNQLQSLGYSVVFVTHAQGQSHLSSVFIREKAQAPIKTWEEVQLSPQYIWIVPEGWPNALVLGINAGARCIVYVQSWSYALRTLSDGVHWSQLPVEFLYVSEPVRQCLKDVTGKDGPIVRPALDSAFFAPPQLESAKGQAVQGAVRIAWMPRKNKGFAAQIIDALAQRLAHTQPHMSVKWVEIEKMSLQDVGKTLQQCHIFLATAFPEGFALPPLEAMACGCIPVGFSGLGGWDYMRSCSLPERAMPFLAKPFFVPSCTVTDAIGNGNGFFVEDAHVWAATLALEQALLLLYGGGDALAMLRINMARTAASYSAQAQRAQLQMLEPFFTA